jgi:hypothetical protein
LTTQHRTTIAPGHVLGSRSRHRVRVRRVDPDDHRLPLGHGLQAKKAGEQERARIKADREEARRADERSLRDAKQEGLRGDYIAVSFAAENLRGASSQLMVLWAGDTREARAERIQRQLEEATADLYRAIIRLRLEEGTRAIVDAYQRVRTLGSSTKGHVSQAEQSPATAAGSQQ